MNNYYNDTWEQVKYKSYKFPVIYNTDRFEICRVHPLMQEGAIKINQAVIDDDRVVCVMLFGSATNIRCNKNSDFDLLVRLKEEYDNWETKNEVSEKIQEACDWNADVIWYNRDNENSQLYRHVIKGVQIV